MDKALVFDLIKRERVAFLGAESVAVLDDMERQLTEWHDTARKVKFHKPILKDSPIAFPIWRCTNCGHEERTGRGFYCRMCGRRFEE